MCRRMERRCREREEGDHVKTNPKTKKPSSYVVPKPKDAAEASALRTAALVWRLYWAKHSSSARKAA